MQQSPGGQRKVMIRIEGHNPSSQIERSIIRIAQEINSGISSILHPRKRNKPPITLLSGPHVHKKSRDQHKMERSTIIFMFDIQDEHN